MKKIIFTLLFCSTAAFCVKGRTAESQLKTERPITPIGSPADEARRVARRLSLLTNTSEEEQNKITAENARRFMAALNNGGSFESRTDEQ